MTPRSAPVIPRATGVAWTLAPLADRRRVDIFLRLFGARALPTGVNRGRLAAMDLPPELTSQTLRRVRRIADWDLAWTWAAQRALGEARTHQRASAGQAAALAQRQAALAYHLAGMLVFDDTRKVRALRSSASTLFAQSLPVLQPAARRVEIDPPTLSAALHHKRAALHRQLACRPVFPAPKHGAPPAPLPASP